MKIAYLVLAHANPKHLERMIGTLSCEDCSFFLHIDAKSNIDNFRQIRAKNIFFTERRIRVYWAEYSMVEAILLLIQQALGAEGNHDYYVLLSGSDYPLRSKEYIHAFFEKMNGKQFISMVKMPSTRCGLPLSKINKFRVPSTKPAYRFTVRVLDRIHLANRDYRKYLGPIQPWGGHTWWALTRDACRYILKFVKENPRVCEFFKNTATSDEMFFHTILGNSPFAAQARRGLMYTDWPGPHHPVLINEKHVEAFEKQEMVGPSLNDAYGPGEMLFARKFSDEGVDLLEKIDKMAKQKDRKLKARS